MKFGKMAEALQEGKIITRESWEKGTFIFMQVPAKIPIEIIPKMQSLPQSVKDIFIQRTNENEGVVLDGIGFNWYESIRYKNQLAIVSPVNEIEGYLPSPRDILANDWIVIE